METILNKIVIEENTPLSTAECDDVEDKIISDTCISNSSDPVTVDLAGTITRSANAGESIDLLSSTGMDGLSHRSLSVIKLSENRSIFIPFTSKGEKHLLHYLEEEKCYTKCNGTPCALCEIGIKKEERTLIPLYDCVAEEVRVLLVSQTETPHALLPQLREALRLVKDSGPKLLLLSKTEWSKFQVVVKDIPEGVGDGNAVIQGFVTAWECGDVRLSDAVSTMEDSQLRSLPWVAKRLKFRGI